LTVLFPGSAGVGHDYFWRVIGRSRRTLTVLKRSMRKSECGNATGKHCFNMSAPRKIYLRYPKLSRAEYRKHERDRARAWRHTPRGKILFNATAKKWRVHNRAAFKKRIYQIRIRRQAKTKTTAFSHQQHWTAADDFILVRWKGTLRALAVELGRTFNSILHRSRRLRGVEGMDGFSTGQGINKQIYSSTPAT